MKAALKSQVDLARTIRKRLELLADAFPRTSWRAILQEESKAAEQVIIQWPLRHDNGQEINP